VIAERRESPSASTTALPPGQRARIGPLPRFGLDAYLKRRVATRGDFALRIDGDVKQAIELSLNEIFVVRSEFVADLHSVTTWSAVGLRWSGRPFRSFGRT
jgi:DMSO/TMAO reductase YedYZ molybdopterin-dependent catalytic subunit